MEVTRSRLMGLGSIFRQYALKILSKMKCTHLALSHRFLMIFSFRGDIMRQINCYMSLPSCWILYAIILLFKFFSTACISEVNSSFFVMNNLTSFAFFALIWFCVCLYHLQLLLYSIKLLKMMALLKFWTLTILTWKFLWSGCSSISTWK